MASVSIFRFGFSITPEAFQDIIKEAAVERRLILKNLTDYTATGQYGNVTALLEHDAMEEVSAAVLGEWEGVQQGNAEREPDDQYTFRDVVLAVAQPVSPRSPFSRSTSIMGNLVDDVRAYVKSALFERVNRPY